MHADGAQHRSGPWSTGFLAVQAELEAELALAWGQLYGRRLDISRQAHIGQDRGQALGDAISIPAELRCVSCAPDSLHSPCASTHALPACEMLPAVMGNVSSIPRSSGPSHVCHTLCKTFVLACVNECHITPGARLCAGHEAYCDDMQGNLQACPASLMVGMHWTGVGQSS